MFEVIGLCAVAGVMAGIMMVPMRSQLWQAALVGGITALLLAGGYVCLGNGVAWRAHLAEALRMQEAKTWMHTFKNTEEVIQHLRERLSHMPNSAKGWFLLGRVYSSQARWGEAQAAFSRAHRLAPNELAYEVSDLMSQWQIQHQRMSTALQQRFLAVLKRAPTQPDVLACLAIEATHQHQTALAMRYWRRLLAVLPGDSEEAAFVRQAIAALH